MGCLEVGGHYECNLRGMAAALWLWEPCSEIRIAFLSRICVCVSFKFSAYTLWMKLSSDLEFISAPVLGFGSLTAHSSPNFALKCLFRLWLSPESEKGSLNKLRTWSLHNLIETPHFVSTEFEYSVCVCVCLQPSLAVLRALPCLVQMTAFSILYHAMVWFVRG